MAARPGGVGMKTAAWMGLCLAVLSCAGVLPAGADETSPWGADLDVALREADAGGRLAVVTFYAPWNPWCAKMERDTFADLGVQERLDRLVPVRVNTDERRDLAERFGIETLPSTVVLNGRGQVLARLAGYQTPALLTPVLDDALAGRLRAEEPQIAEPATPGEQEGMDNPLPALAERMWDVKRGHLDNGDPGPITQDKERMILDQLDELIEQAEKT